jgi:type II secretory pathway pseudopilin PulG
MNALQQTTIIVLSILAIFNSSCLTVFANQSDSINYSKSTQFASNLKSKIQNLISGESNDSSTLFNSNSGAFLDNNSNMSSNQLIISSNKITSSISNNNSGNNSFVKDKVTIINGACKSEKVAGNGNDTLFSTGNCDDELTGGTGADKFSCGEGNDTIKDYDPKEGDIILDQQNCENIL